MEGFQFGEQTQGAATSLNCETGGGERGSGSGHRLSNTPDFHIRHQMLGLTPLGGGKRKALGQGCPKEGGCGRLVPHSMQGELSLQPSSPTHTITQRHFHSRSSLPASALPLWSITAFSPPPSPLPDQGCGSASPEKQQEPG